MRSIGEHTMKITIDTKEDSHEDIQKVLHLLASLKNNESGYSPTASTATDSIPMMGMFDAPEMKEVPDTPPNFNAFLNLGRGDKDPKVELF